MITTAGCQFLASILSNLGDFLESLLTIVHARFHRRVNLSLPGISSKSNDHLPG